MYTHEKCTFLVDHHQAENIWHIIAGLGSRNFTVQLDMYVLLSGVGQFYGLT